MKRWGTLLANARRAHGPAWAVGGALLLFVPLGLGLRPEAARAAEAAGEALCERAKESDHEVADFLVEVRARQVPDRGFYREDAMAQVRQEIEVSRRVDQAWPETERTFMRECGEGRRQREFWAQLTLALRQLGESADCEQWRQRATALVTLGEEARGDVMLPQEMWRLANRMDDINSPSFCQEVAAQPGRARSATTSAFERFKREYGAIVPVLELRARTNEMEGVSQVEQLRREYLSQAAKKFALQPLLEHQYKLREAQEQDSSRTLSDETVGKLPWIIVILGFFCLSIMVMIRRYSENIQREWVQSGQVIQFMTVTIIMIVVLALGLSQNLNQESLGTLLGTIGGYVLSNGIGRRRPEPQGERGKGDADDEEDAKDLGKGQRS